MAVDWRRRRPILANDVGGLSGPAIKPLALRMVWDVARALPDLPIIGIGGIATADDALEFLVAGASAVQVGTATFYDPTASERLLDDLTRHLAEAGVARLSEVVGTLRSNREGGYASDDAGLISPSPPGRRWPEGRMRVTGRQHGPRPQARGRCRSRGPSSAPSGHLLPGEKVERTASRQREGNRAIARARTAGPAWRTTPSAPPARPWPGRSA